MSHRFNSRCDGCSACARQCPTLAIVGELHRPHRVIAELCIDCGVCGMICPIAAVEDEHGRIASRLRRDRRPRPVIDPLLCSGCALCTDYCPFACLALVGRAHHGIAVLAEPMACVSCGECADICIKGAVTMRAVDLRALDPAAERTRAVAVLQESEP